MQKGRRLIILFGSRATGKTHGRSDTDVAVLYDHPLDFKEKIELSEEMAKRLGVSEDVIDIADLWVASPLLQYQVAQSGKLIEGDNFNFTRFKVLAWKRYLDTARFRRAREKAFAKIYG